MSLHLPVTGKVLMSLSPSRPVLTPGSEESPIAWFVAIWPPIVLGTSRGKGIARGQWGPLPYPTGFPHKQAARCVCPPAWTGGAARGQGWTSIPELPLWSGRKGKSRLGSSAACCPLFPLKRHEVHWQNSGFPNLG